MTAARKIAVAGAYRVPAIVGTDEAREAMQEFTADGQTWRIGDWPRCYLIYTKARQEELADANLRAQGYQTLFPHDRRIVKNRWRHRQLVIVPQLTRYLFVLLLPDRQQSLYAVNNTVGVSMVVTFNDRPLEIPHPVMDALFDHLDGAEEGFRPKPKPKRVLQPGQHVRVNSKNAVFEGFAGQIAEIVDDERIKVWVEIFRRATPVEMHPEAVDVL